MKPSDTYSLQQMRAAFAALRLEVPSSVSAAVELKVWSHVEHVTSSRDKLYEAFSQAERERDAALRDLERLCGPICPHDGKRAIEHNLIPGAALGAGADRCRFTYDKRNGQVCAQLDNASHGLARPTHTFEPMRRKHPFWLEGQAWLQVPR